MKLPTYLILTTLMVHSQALTGKQDADLDPVSKPCEDKTKVSKQLIDDLFNRKIRDFPKYDNSQALRAYLVCVDTTGGYYKKDGTLNLETWKKTLKDGNISNEKVDELVKKCVVQRDTQEETSFQAYRCLYNNGV
ncbi:hypothetical protein Zmor_019600 [Zophobas morio]|uniref:Uncharacterized protein n=1 Tax=Zophobas morio TaxID=2755281 RepID=A0AA38M998_9CUCU|nr:hypothetical protein Zmor_019600 [Zophobas morio]